MRPTVEQTVMLAAIERQHGQLKRIPDESKLGEQLLGSCVTDTRAYTCASCLTLFTIDPDGETDVWAPVEPRS